MKIYSIIFISTITLLLFSPLSSQTKLDERAKQKQDALLEKNKASQEKILAKYAQFYSKLKDRYPGLNFEELPVDPSLAKDVIDHNDAPGADAKKTKQIFGYASESFILKSEPNLLPKFNLPFKTKRGEKVEVVLVLKNDEEVKKEKPNWCLIRLSSKQEGYIPSEYLSPSIINKNDTQERRLASVKPPTTRAFAFPTEVNSNKKSRNLESDILKDEEGNQKTDDKFKDKDFWVSASSLNIRENPDINSYIIDRIAKGEKVKVILSTNNEETIDGISDVWHQIQSGYQKGWVFGGYLSQSEIAADYGDHNNGPAFPQENPEELKSGEKRYVRSISLRLRDEPNDYGTVVTSIPGDEKVKIIDAKPELETIGGVRSRWIYVSWDDTWEGWVFGGFVSKDKGQLVDNDDISKYFQLPVDNDRYVSSAYGTRVDPVTGKVGAFHSGVDLPASVGTPIRAVSDGKVWRTITTSGGYGVLTILSHKNNIYTYYAHQNERKVAEGEVVKSGDIIGEVGNTGKSTGPHLHFEVRKGPSQQALDPGAYLPK